MEEQLVAQYERAQEGFKYGANTKLWLGLVSPVLSFPDRCQMIAMIKAAVKHAPHREVDLADGLGKAERMNGDYLVVRPNGKVQLLEELDDLTIKKIAELPAVKQLARQAGRAARTKSTDAAAAG